MSLELTAKKIHNEIILRQYLLWKDFNKFYYLPDNTEVHFFLALTLTMPYFADRKFGVNYKNFTLN